MQMSQLKLGVLLSYTAQAIHLVISLAYTPIMLRILGQNEYGVYQLVNSFVSYLSLMSLGFGASYIRFYSIRKMRNNQKDIDELNGMYMAFFLTVSLFTLAIGFILAGQADAIFISLSAAEIATSKKLMFILVLNIALTFPMSVFDSYIIAHEKFIFQRLLTVIQYLVNPFFSLPLLLLGFRSVSLVVVTTVITILKLLCDMYYCFHFLHMKFDFKGFKIGLFREIAVFSCFIFIRTIVDQINWSLDKFLLGRYGGSSAVAVYAVGSQINTMYISLSTSISAVFAPRINRLVAEDDGIQISKLFVKVGRLQVILMSYVLCAFIFYGETFVRLWAGDVYNESYIIAIILMSSSVVQLIQNLGIEIQMAKNMHKLPALVYLIIAVTNVLITIPLIKLLGATGAAVGTAITYIVGTVFFMNWYYANRIALDMRSFWLNISSLIKGIIPSLFVAILWKEIGFSNGIFHYLLSICIFTIFFVLGLWFLGMNEYEKDLLRTLKSKVLRRYKLNEK